MCSSKLMNNTMGRKGFVTWKCDHNQNNCFLLWLQKAEFFQTLGLLKQHNQSTHIGTVTITQQNQPCKGSNRERQRVKGRKRERTEERETDRQIQTDRDRDRDYQGYINESKLEILFYYPNFVSSKLDSNQTCEGKEHHLQLNFIYKNDQDKNKIKGFFCTVTNKTKTAKEASSIKTSLIVNSFPQILYRILK